MIRLGSDKNAAALVLNKEAPEDMPRKNISKWRMVMFTFQGRGIGVTHPGKPPSNSFQPTAKPSNCLQQIYSNHKMYL